jgi:hypothetical protein
MFWAFKLSFDIDICWRLFRLHFEKLGEFFSNLLVTLVADRFEKDKKILADFFKEISMLPNITFSNDQIAELFS